MCVSMEGATGLKCSDARGQWIKPPNRVHFGDIASSYPWYHLFRERSVPRGKVIVRLKYRKFVILQN